MPGYGQFCPVAVASEVFAERWTPLILRELFNGSRRFSDFCRGMPLISRALLAQHSATWRTRASSRAHPRGAAASTG